MTTPKVLIVDDESMNLELLEIILTDEGIAHIDKAYDGREALNLYEDALLGGQPYNVIFLDISMPIMDGQEVLKQVRNREEKSGTRAKIIMATVDKSPETLVKTMLEFDADDHISKPYVRNEIHESLKRHRIIKAD